jgi:hypothetical protein
MAGNAALLASCFRDAADVVVPVGDFDAVVEIDMVVRQPTVPIRKLTP